LAHGLEAQELAVRKD